MTETDCLCPDYPTSVHASCPVHPHGARNLILGLAGATAAAGDQAQAMTADELGGLLLAGRWTTIEVHEAGRRLSAVAARLSEAEAALRHIAAEDEGEDYDDARLEDVLQLDPGSFRAPAVARAYFAGAGGEA